MPDTTGGACLVLCSQQSAPPARRLSERLREIGQQEPGDQSHTESLECGKQKIQVTFEDFLRKENNIEDINKTNTNNKTKQFKDVTAEINKYDLENAVAEVIRNWLNKIERFGFSNTDHEILEYDDRNDTIDKVAETAVGDEFVMIERSMIATAEVALRGDGRPCGQGSLTLTTGEVLWGAWRSGLREGRGGARGGRLARAGVARICGVYSGGVLQAGSVEWESGLTATGARFEAGLLTGRVVARAASHPAGGQPLWAGSYRAGLPGGRCWARWRGGGAVTGTVDNSGRFSGPDTVFLYPDLFTCIVGRTEAGHLLAGRAGQVVAATTTGDSLQLRTVLEGGEAMYSFKPSDSKAAQPQPTVVSKRQFIDARIVVYTYFSVS